MSRLKSKAPGRSFRKSRPEHRLIRKYVFPGGELGHVAQMIEALEGARFEVHDVEGRGPVGDPAAGHGGGVAAEHGFLRVVALTQPYAGAAQQVDGGEDLHAVASVHPRGGDPMCPIVDGCRRECKWRQ